MSWLRFLDNKPEKFQHGNTTEKSPTKYRVSAIEYPPFPIEIMHSFTGKPEQKLKLESSEGFISASTKF